MIFCTWYNNSDSCSTLILAWLVKQKFAGEAAQLKIILPASKWGKKKPGELEEEPEVAGMDHKINI